MCLITNQLTACIIFHGIDDGGTNNYLYAFPIFITVVVASYASCHWKFFAQWLGGIRGRDWAAVSAIIDVISVIPHMVETRYDERVMGYIATLTYFYRNPDLQMGEYSRMFDEENDAQVWAASYKGRTVMVHIDPRDPTNSVLRKEDL